MQFLANENFPGPSLTHLENHGLDVMSIAKTYPGISDNEVIKIASINKRIILTFDRDYGALIFHRSVVSPPPVIYFRDIGETPLHAAHQLISIIDTDIIFEGFFTVVDATGIRQRKLP